MIKLIRLLHNELEDLLLIRLQNQTKTRIVGQPFTKINNELEDRLWTQLVARLRVPLDDQIYFKSEKGEDE